MVLESEEFQTINGPVRFRGPENISTTPTVNQWQKGELEIVWPSAVASSSLLLPKPPWP